MSTNDEKSSINIDKSELEFNFIRSSGPGGQNVNKVSTAVQLRFDIERCASLTAEQKTRLQKLAGFRMNNDGFLVIEAKRYRSQEKNREDAVKRFNVLLQRSLEKPKPRRKTSPTRASQIKRVDSKRRDAVKKQYRKKVKSEVD